MSDSSESIKRTEFRNKPHIFLDRGTWIFFPSSMLKFDRADREAYTFCQKLQKSYIKPQKLKKTRN